MNALTVPSRLREAPPAVFFYLVGIFALGFTIDGGIYSVLQNLYLLRLGFGPEFIGLYNSAGLFIFALLSLPIGAIRRWSSRRLLLVGVVLTLAGILIIPLAQWGPLLWQPALLLSGRIISLIGLSFFFVHSAPFVMGITSGEWQNRTLAWQSATLSLAGFGGGLLGGYLPGWIAGALGVTLDNPTPYQYPLFLASGILALTFVAILKTPEPVIEIMTPSESSSVIKGSAQPTWTGPIGVFVALIALVRILQVAAPGALLTFGNVYFDDGLNIATSKIGIITAIGKLISVPIALITPRLLERWGSFRMVMMISLISVVAALPMALSENWELAGLGFILASGAGPLRYLAFLVFTLSLVSSERRALISGAGEMAIGFGFALMALVGGYLIAQYSYAHFFGVSLILSLIGTGLYWLLFRRSL